MVDALLQHEVEGRVDRLVKEAEELESKLAELVDELVIKVAEPKEFDGKGGVVAYICWGEKMEAVQDISGCGDNQKVKYSTGSLTDRALTWWNFEVRAIGHEAAVGMTWEIFKALMKGEYCPSNEMQRLETEFWSHSMVGASYSAYTDRFHELARLVHHLVTPKTKRIERVLTDEAVRNGSLKRTDERRGDDGESSKEGNVKGDNKRARTGKVFATITNPVRKEYMGSAPKCTNCNFHHNPETPCRACMNCNHLGHFAKDHGAGPKMVNPLNSKNSTTTRGACYECGALAIEGGQVHANNGNPACGRAFVMGAKEARQDLNIVTGTFSLNNHYAMMLFDSGVDYSFLSTTFMPLLDIKPSSPGFSYEIEIASEQLVVINKVIRGCKLKIEGHTFDIDLIPFRHGSFDAIIGMNWLSRHRAEIVCHERVVRIPLPHGEMLRVYEERPEEKVKCLMSAKAKEPKLEDFAIVRNFSEVFPEDLSGLPPS
ncbi:putative reverse transcriptase domain-containing protein [Tanacetum coccineum]